MERNFSSFSNTRKDNEETIKKSGFEYRVKNKTEKYIPQMIYIEAAHKKALYQERADTGKDMSEITRAALDLYFGSKMNRYRK